MADRDLIEDLAREAGFDGERILFDAKSDYIGLEQLRRFAALLIEACATLAEQDAEYVGEEGEEGIALGSREAARRIRAMLQ